MPRRNSAALKPRTRTRLLKRGTTVPIVGVGGILVEATVVSDHRLYTTLKDSDGNVSIAYKPEWMR